MNVLNVIFFSVYLLLSWPNTAHAYLDPGTGNVLVYVCISLVGALIYAGKGAFYALLKLLGRRLPDSDAAGEAKSRFDRIVLFSEGKSYWNTFKPLVEAFIARQFPVSYLTMDVADPGLTIENDFLDNRYIGRGTLAYHRLNNLRAEILVATTPNIGTPGYPIRRSPRVERLTHILHGIDDIAFYHKGSLDLYDEVLMNGAYLADSIREVEHKRGLKEKTLVVLGLPYLDVLASKMRHPLPVTDGHTILVAPSWGEKGLLPYYGSGFMQELLKAGYNVILRPHPQSYKVEGTLLDTIRKELSSYENFSWDSEPDGSLSMEKADLMISDRSNVRLDFALLYERPVITLTIPFTDPDDWGVHDPHLWDEWEAGDLKELWSEKVACMIGIKLGRSEIGRLPEHVKRLLAERKSEDLSAMRDEWVANFRHSGEAMADYLISSLRTEDNATPADTKKKGALC